MITREAEAQTFSCRAVSRGRDFDDVLHQEKLVLMFPFQEIESLDSSAENFSGLRQNAGFAYERAKLAS